MVLEAEVLEAEVQGSDPRITSPPGQGEDAGKKGGERAMTKMADKVCTH